MSGGAVRTDHLTFLVLAGAVALVAFAFGEVPMLLLPPAVPFSRPGAPLGAALRGRRSTLGVTPRTAWALRARWWRRSARKTAIRRRIEDVPRAIRGGAS